MTGSRRSRPVQSPNEVSCTVAHCNLTVRSSGLCSGHYSSMRYRRSRGLNPDLTVALKVGGPAQDPQERFWSHVQRSEGCWRWTGALSPKGYARFWLDFEPVAAHRYAYELARGPIAPGMTIDHLCRNKACMNPDHLEVVTRAENTARMRAFVTDRALVAWD